MYKNYEELGQQPEKNRDVMNVLEIANIQHKQQIISSHRVVVVDIYADWCGPCKQTAPDYAVIASTYTKPRECAIVKYNYDKLDPSERVNIHGIPVFQFFLDGRQVDEVVGADIEAVKVKLTDIMQTINSHRVEITQNNLTSTESGPNYSRNSIRNTRNSIPHTNSYGQSYTSNSGRYYQTN